MPHHTFYKYMDICNYNSRDMRYLIQWDLSRSMTSHDIKWDRTIPCDVVRPSYDVVRGHKTITRHYQWSYDDVSFATAYRTRIVGPRTMSYDLVRLWTMIVRYTTILGIAARFYTWAPKEEDVVIRLTIIPYDCDVVRGRTIISRWAAITEIHLSHVVVRRLRPVWLGLKHSVICGRYCTSKSLVTPALRHHLRITD
jgi:hypothetical protein